MVTQQEQVLLLQLLQELLLWFLNGYCKRKFPTISGFDVKKLLIRGADRSPNMEYPNKIWGYGKIDAYSIYENLI
jgi:hypothetical protein